MYTRLAAVPLALALSTPVLAIKPYTLVEDGYPEKLGQVELENTFEFDFHKREDSSFKHITAEHELEWGVTDNFDLRIKGSYFYEDSADLTGLHFDAAGVEGQFYFTNPSTDWIGVSLLAAMEAGEQSLAFETVLVVQKDWERFVATYNLGFETEIEGVFTDHGSTETTGTITNALGAVYYVTDTLRAGGEIAAESSYANWSHYDGTNVWAGPVVNWVPTKTFWFTLGLDFQLTDTSDEPDYRFTLIAGYFF